MSPTSATRRFSRSTIIASVVAVLIIAVLVRQVLRDETPRPNLTRKLSASLLIAGGGPLPASVRNRFIELAGGPTARIVIIPAYEPEVAALARLKGLWKDFELASLTILSADSHEQADRAEFVSPLISATGVWLSGGTQEFLAERYVGSHVEHELQSLLKRGGVVGGTSAGASIMTRLMILEGRQEATLGRGLDLLPDAVIDQHFLKRNRLTRLRGVLQKHPQLIGFGIDESTALQVHLGNGSLQVVGNSYVMAVVPGLEESGLRLEILKAGDEANLISLRDPNVPVATAYEFDESFSE